MWLYALTWFGVALAPSGADVQISVGPNVQMSQTRARAPHLEVVIAADPRDPARLLAAAIIATRGIAAYRSSDGGKTWTEALVIEKSTADPRADPVIQSICDPTIAWGADGVYYALIYLLKANMQLSTNPVPLELRRSADGGKTWAAPIRATDDHLDRPFLTVDQSSGKFGGRVYCDFSVDLDGKGPRLGILTSSDGGKTFGPFRYMGAEKQYSFVRGGQSAVLVDGTFIVPYVVLHPSPQVIEIRVRRSTTGGESFLPEQSLTTLDGDIEGEALYPIIPIMAADPGSPRFKDRVYLVWQQYIGKRHRVVLVCSKDKGATWSKPIVVSEQSEDQAYDAVLPAVAVNRKGIAAVTWYDSRESRPAVPCSNIRFRASLDGGDTWLASVRVSDAPSPMALDRQCGKLGRDGRDLSLLGETAGLVADAAGDFHAAWVDKRTGVQQIFTARISVTEKER